MKTQSKSALVAAMLSITMLYTGCSATTDVPSPAQSSADEAQEQAQAAEEARAAEQARKVTEAFPEVEADNTATTLDMVRNNFNEVRKVRMRSSASDGSHLVPDEVVLTPSGVYANSKLSGTFAETVVVNDGEDGYLRASAKFWTGSGMTRDAARRAAGQWVQMGAVASPDQVLDRMRERLVSEFETEWGTGTGAVTLVTFRTAPAVRVDTVDGYVLATGEPLLPVKYVFERDGKTSRMVFSYEGVQPVRTPAKNVSLDAVVSK